MPDTYAASAALSTKKYMDGVTLLKTTWMGVAYYGIFGGVDGSLSLYILRIV
jgi:hypothetical protein